MNEYTASNGVRIEDRGGSLHANGSLIIGAGSTFRAALAEFFRAEEDESLGRWRWPENPELVVYPLEDSHSAKVLHEPSGQILTYKRGEYPDHKTGYSGAGNAYFDAHPEPKPAWHDAKPGEVWEVKSEAGTFNAWRLESGAFMFAAGRRVWPES